MRRVGQHLDTVTGLAFAQVDELIDYIKDNSEL